MSNDLKSKLIQLKDLHESGLLTDDEFAEQKRATIASVMGTTPDAGNDPATPLPGATTLRAPDPTPNAPLAGTQTAASAQTAAPETAIPSGNVAKAASPQREAPVAAPLEEDVRSPKKREVYIALAILLGGAGAHNFYIGHHGKAVAQLVLALLLGWLVIPFLVVVVWITYECFTVKHDAEGRLLR